MRLVLEFQGCMLSGAREFWPLFVGGARVQSDTQAGGGVALLATVRKRGDLELAAVFTIPS